MAHLFQADLEAITRGMQSATLPVGSGSGALTLHLHRLPRPNAKAVLLTHGGNTRADIFLVPCGGLAGYLYQRGYDVWLLDWRGSNRVVDPLVKHCPPLGGSVAAERAIFTMDRAAEEDLPAAIAHIRDAIGAATPLSMVGYCVSSGVLSMAVARGALEPFGIQHFVLLSLGLFYEVPWNGWVKVEDFLLERILDNDPNCRAIDPDRPDRWPRDLRAAYAVWPARWLPPRSPALLHYLSFMIGQAWETERIHPSLRGEVRQFFGAFHMGLYLHAGQMVRRGYAAPFGSAERLMGDGGRVPGSDLDPRCFDRRKHFTLVVPQNNGVWHRNAMDLMSDWLQSHTQSTSRKLVMRGYNLHELLWGTEAARDVFPAIAAGLA